MQSTWLMAVMASETKVGVDGADNLRAAAIGIIIIPGLNSARAVSQLANRSQVISCVVVVGRTDLHSLRIEAFRDGVARVTLFARLCIAGTPEELFRTGDVSTLFFNNFNALTQSIVGKLASVRTTRHGGEPIYRIPFKRPRVVTGKITIGIIHERFASAAGDSHIILIRGSIAVFIGCLDRDGVVSGGHPRFSFKAIVSLRRRIVPVHEHPGELVCGASNWP